MLIPQNDLKGRKGYVYYKKKINAQDLCDVSDTLKILFSFYRNLPFTKMESQWNWNQKGMKEFVFNESWVQKLN